MNISLRKVTNLLVSFVVLMSMTIPSLQSSPVSAQAQTQTGLHREYNAESGKVTLITGENHELISVLGPNAVNLTPEAQSLALVQHFGSEFGLTNPAKELKLSEINQPDAGRVVSKYQQMYQGVPVMAGELMVNATKAGELISMNGEVSQGLSLDTKPELTDEAAIENAKQGMVKWYGSEVKDYDATQSSLWIFDETLLRPSIRSANLVWRIEMVSAKEGAPIRELVLVDAKTGNISLHFNQVDTVWTTAPADRDVPGDTPTPTPPIIPENDISSEPNAEVLLAPITYYVNISTGNDSNSCTSIAAPCKHIQEAINKAASGDVINVAIGTYLFSTNGSPNVVIINKDITLSGGWNTSFTSQNGASTIDGANTKNGILVISGTVIVENFIVQNSTSSNSGAIYIVNGNFTLRKSTLRNNVATSSGAGIFIDNGIINIINSTISGNTASWSGGAIYASNNISSSVNIQNSTIVYNTAPTGGGIKQVNGTYNITNTILANNSSSASSPDCAGVISTANYNIIEDMEGCVVIDGAHNLNVDPGIDINLTGAMPVHMLLAGSPAIDNGFTTGCPSTDQQGTTRPRGYSCDIGSVEYIGIGAKSIHMVSGSGQNNLINTVFTEDLVALALDENDLPMSGVHITFTAPTSGASGTFNTFNLNTTIVTTDINGFASSTFTANGVDGAYSVSASASGFVPAQFQLSNHSTLVSTYTTGGTSSLPGTFLCNQTQPNCTNGSNPHADAAHNYAMGTYSLYATKYLRDSIGNNGMIIKSTVHYCSSTACPYANAFWNGTQMVYGDAYGFPLADDVVAHELTHGVTQYEANLFYFYQSGAINESLSDVWGEYYDQTNVYGNDTPAVKWQMGEDISGLGAIRSMSNPPLYGDPDKMTSPNYDFDIDPNFWDNGGVHSNSGINNKAVFLMVDGGSFNGKTVSALGWDKTAAIYYEANTNLLSSGADYSDLYYAVQQACVILTGELGITASDCQQVKNALDAVEMNSQPVANFNPDAPVCATGYYPLPIFQDNMESGTGKWTMTGNWSLANGYASSPAHMLYGDDYYPSSDSSAAMAAGVTIPAGSTVYLHFKHAFAFEYYQGQFYDGAVLEYSINNGSSWADASPLFVDGRNYTGTVMNYSGTTNALKGRSGFVADSHGYVSSRYNLSSLTGQTVKLRWRFATDSYGYYLGWMVDDVQIYTCTPIPSAPVVVSSAHADADPTNASSVNFTVTFTQNVTGVNISDFAPVAMGVLGAAVTGVSGSGSVYTVTVNTGSGAGSIRLNVVDDDSIRNAYGSPLGGAGAGNGNFTFGETYTIIPPAPVVVSSARADADPTNASNVNFTVTFTQDVTGVDASDFSPIPMGVLGAAVSGVSGSGSVYTVTVNTGSGSGSVRLNVLDDDSIVNAYGSPLGGTGADNGTFTFGETYTINKTWIFGDVPNTYWSWSFIERLYNAGITGGCTAVPLNYCPTNSVTRAQMAVFLVRAMHGVAFVPPTATG
ncbi:MAG: M4 family metallopeptidase, partial [Chloroflexi bacterium]|nr:M4 family metallopeptidase [Chloroflexota bacterium]